jgi:membrane-associated protein
MLDPVLLIKTFGLLGIFLIIFSETGLFFGFFLPGDTLLFASGVLAAQGVISIQFLILGVSLSAILGASVGYWSGKKFGRTFFEKEGAIFFDKKKIKRVEHFYDKYGSITVLFSRFIPVARTFAPIVAGIAKMNYRIFFLYNILGGVLWTLIVSLAGYYFGSLIPNIDKLLLPAIFFVVALSLAPILFKIAQKFIFKSNK